MMASLPEAFSALSAAFTAHRRTTLTYTTGTVTVASPLTVTDVGGATFKPVDMLAGHHTYTDGMKVGVLRTPSSRPLVFPIT